MRIGLIDVDGHNYPNLPLMKISAYHKAKGDSVEWYQPLIHNIGEPLDIVYKSKVFSFSQDYEYPINAKKVVGGGGHRVLYRTERRERNISQREGQKPA